MTYEEIIKQARADLGSYCKGCLVCDGRVCKNTIPGPGAKGSGTGAINNYLAWQDICVEMDTLCPNRSIDTSLELFGKTFKYPFFAGPVGAVNMHYGDKYDDLAYNNILVAGCAKAGIAAFTGDGVNHDVMKFATDAIALNEGIGVPTVKPWNIEMVKEKLELVKRSNSFAVAMDIDAAGLPFLKNMTPPAGSKSVEEMAQIINLVEKPFIIKGIMNVKGALKAVEAGASAIVVSNHGGRVLDGCPSTAEVLPEIADAVGSQIKILVDGGIRSGLDVFKALALGADGVIICRPFVSMVYGGAQEAIEVYVEKIGSELADTMAMCGASTLSEISRDMIRY